MIKEEVFRVITSMEQEKKRSIHVAYQVTVFSFLNTIGFKIFLTGFKENISTSYVNSLVFTINSLLKKRNETFTKPRITEI